MREYLVPVTIAEERLITVLARSPEDAKSRVRAGRYKKLGRPLTRGFLIVGQPAEKVSEVRS
jgi:hypothetical protein